MIPILIKIGRTSRVGITTRRLRRSGRSCGGLGGSEVCGTGMLDGRIRSIEASMCCTLLDCCVIGNRISRG